MNDINVLPVEFQPLFDFDELGLERFFAILDLFLDSVAGILSKPLLQFKHMYDRNTI